MVSRYGVSKEGAVGVAVGVGPMHCLLPHCGGPHHHHHLSAPHPQNPQPGHNHHVHPAHQPPPSPSPHLNHQLSHHQLTVNINHLSHQQQQQQQNQHQQAPPQYRVVTANARSDFHVSGQNYGTQPGGQVGGGGGSVGVPGGRGPPPLGGLQSIGQSAAGIPPGGPAGGQAPPQTPAPGVQSQPPQGPAPTTTPPVHTPSPQEMGKQAHLPPQPQPLSQVYGPTQTRPTSQGYYPGPRPQQPRGISHRGGQGGTGAQVVGMSGVGGGGGQPTAIYHTGGLPVQTGAMYQVPNLHPGPHQQSVYAMNSQIPLQFGGPPQRHQTHQNQSYFPPFQHSAIITAQNVFGYGAPAPTASPYYWPTSQPPNTPLNLSRAGGNAVTGGAQHVAGPLAGAQGAPVVPQGALQQPTQQAQPLPPMGISLSQTDVYSGHNGGASNTTNTKSRKPRGQNAITDIVDPTTGKNISHEIYKDNETVQSGESSNRGTPQPQNNDAEVQADFAARVAKTLAKVVTEESSSDSTVPTCVPNTSTTQNITQSLSNSQINSANDVSSQCNTNSPATQNVPNVIALSSQSLGTTSNVAQLDSCPVKTESKPLQIPVKEFQPRSEPKSVVIEEPPPAAPRNVNKDDISAQLPATTVTEVEVKSTSVTTTVTQTSVPVVTIPSTNVPEVPKPSATAPSANPVPAREPFPNLSNKNSSSSPPRRKSQTHTHNQPAATATTPTAVTTEMPSSAKEQKEKKTREKSLSSRGTTPTPAHSQADHHLKANGDATGDKQESEPARTEVQQQKSSDGKAMQKQKSKNKLKPRELNRKGAEKEGTDMDAFVNTVPPAKPEIKQDSKEALTPKDSNKEVSREITEDIKEKDNYESKKEKEISSVLPKMEKQATPMMSEIPKESTPIQAPATEKLPSNKETIKESSPKIEDSNKSNVCNMQAKSVPNDVVDHAKVEEESDVEAIVAQKNEENSKVSAIGASNEEKPQASPVIEKSIESDTLVQTETTPGSNQTQLKYKYKDDQWSPINTSGKKVYDREFLMKLQDDPNSKIKPSNLPDLDVVLKDGSKARGIVDIRSFRDIKMISHDSLLPLFLKPSLNARVLPPSRKSHPGKSSKPAKTNVIHMSLSLREDVKLRETENAWKPTRLKSSTLSEEEAKTEALYKRVRSVLNKLTPQKFNTLIEQVRSLSIDTPERLQGVINLVFEKAVDEPSFSVAYALMCKELAMMEVSGGAGPDKTSEKQECSLSFKKLIINRCQKEFERNPINEGARTAKLKEIDGCADPDKRKDLQAQLEDEERKIRIKSVGNIRFIGELFKQGMLTPKIMHRCINDLLTQNDEDSLECLCKLLTTIGKDLESKGPLEVSSSYREMQQYINKMQDIVARRGQVKISSRIRFMLQDVIDLRANKWIPRRDDSNPKTIDQIQKEAESERLVDSQLSNTPLSTPRKDERTSDRKRNRGVGPTDDGGWSQPVVRTRQPYSVETAKLKNKPPPMDDLQLGSRNMYLWKTPSSCGSKTLNSNKFACLENVTNLDQDKRITPPQLSGSRSTGPREYGRDYKLSYDGRSSRNGSHQLNSSSSSRDSSLLDSSQSQPVSMPPPPPLKSSQSTSSSHKPPMTDEELMKTLNKIMKEYLKNPMLEKVSAAIQQNFENDLTRFMHELINFVLEKSPFDRERVSYLLSHLITEKILSIHHLRNGLIKLLDIIHELLIDIPKVWSYLAEILAHPIEEEVLPLAELKPVFDSLRSRGFVGRFLGELLSKVSRDKGSKWVADKWDQSELQLSSVIDPECEELNEIIKKYNLEYCTGDYSSVKSSTSNQLTLQQIHDELTRLMKDSSFDGICDWIILNVGNRVKEPEFIRVLTTAILETSIITQPVNNKLTLKSDVFTNLQQLIRRFVDANESLELQCLYAIQLHLHNLQYPSGILFNIMTSLSDYNIISSDAFLTWKKSPEPAQREWHGVATISLTSFFTGLQEADDASSVEDVSTSATQDRC